MSTTRLSKQIIEHLAGQPNRSQKLGNLARSIGIADSEFGDFRDTVKGLMKSGRLVLGSGQSIMLPDPSKMMIGRFRSNPRGFGFVIPEAPTERGDLFIPPGRSGGALTGDTVAARVIKKGKRDGEMIYEGHIIEIITRGQGQFVGELLSEVGRWFVRPDGNTLHVPIIVGDPGSKNAKAGDQVVVEITQYPTEETDALGVIVKVLGKRGEPGVDTLSILHQYQLPESFPEEVQRATRRVIDAFDPRKASEGREDLRDLTIITIDPDDARDFDDAISLTVLPKGRFELGVHIADVSTFVREGESIDVEARKRATSVYFPGHVVPMLPEVLSNGICSLQERQVRLTKSAFITYNKDGERVGARFAETCIQTAKRLTYVQAQKIIDGKTGRTAKAVVKLLQQMDQLARTIRQRRLRQGMMVLDLKEVEIVLDDDGRPTGVELADSSFTHTIIEMFMVEANEAVAELLASLGVPNIRRIHPPPEPATLESLNRFLRAVGQEPVRAMETKALQAVLERVRDKPESYAVNLAVLRSLSQAEYSPAGEGHFALASEDYVHFTSPIRRYPDLTIHRLFEAYVQGKLANKGGKAKGGRAKSRKAQGTPTYPDLGACEELAAHCSRQERRAEDAERELKLVHMLRLLEKRVGEEFSGIVTGVTNFGLFIQLPEYLVDGLLRFADLGDDWWEVDASAGCVVGQRSGKRIRIGDKIDVSLAAVGIAARTLDLALPGSRLKPRPESGGNSSNIRRRPSRRKETTGRGKPQGSKAAGARKNRGTQKRDTGRRRKRRR